ncbi:GRB2-associated-binding protein 2 [Cricetulus griseus]|nr:GRB2-associated-binding protein 2 [Cricetulus griseus]
MILLRLAVSGPMITWSHLDSEIVEAPPKSRDRRKDSAKAKEEIQPPLVNIHLKSWPKSKASINELPCKSPVTKSWSTVNHTFNYNSSQYYCSISNTDSRDSEENYVPMQNPVSSSPEPSGTNNPAPKKSPSTSSVTSDEKGEYVHVEKRRDSGPTKDHTGMDKDAAVLKTLQRCQTMVESGASASVAWGLAEDAARLQVQCDNSLSCLDFSLELRSQILAKMVNGSHRLEPQDKARLKNEAGRGKEELQGS